MKVVGIHGLKLEDCIHDAQEGGVIITRNGKPVALVVGVEGMDLEELQLAHSDKFWALINERRKQKTVTRAELERQLSEE